MIIFIAFILSLICVYMAIKVSYKFDIVDKPSYRKVHSDPKPRFGGLGIFLAFTLAILYTGIETYSNKIILIGGILIFILGALDDIFDLKAKHKFIVQLFIAVFVVYNGITFEYITNIFTGDIWQIGIFGSVLAVIWIVGVINAVNLIDGLDGLSSGIVIISSTFLMLSSIIEGKPINPLLLILIGVTLGFLVYNFYPAKTFMGDSGSLFLGYMLAVLSISTFTKNITLVSIASPILVMGIPILDTLFAIIRRISKKQPIFSPDKDHLHHKLLNKGYTQKQAVVMIWFLSVFLGSSSLVFSIIDAKAKMLMFSILTIIVTILANYIDLIDFKTIYLNVKLYITRKKNKDCKKEL